MAVTPEREDAVRAIADEVKKLVRRGLLQHAIAMKAEIDRQFEAVEQLVEVQTDAVIRQMFGGEQVYLGKGSDDRRRQRDAALLADAAAHPDLSVRQLATRHRMSKSQAAEVLKRAKAGSDAGTPLSGSFLKNRTAPR